MFEYHQESAPHEIKEIHDGCASHTQILTTKRAHTNIFF